MRAAQPTTVSSVGFGWYAAALALYVALGYLYKPLLMHWTMGPLFLLVTLYVLPTTVQRVRRRSRGGDSE